MKCVKIKNTNGGYEILRLTDEQAHNRVTLSSNTTYCPKHVWKREIRNAQ